MRLVAGTGEVLYFQNPMFHENCMKKGVLCWGFYLWVYFYLFIKIDSPLQLCCQVLLLQSDQAFISGNNLKDTNLMSSNQKMMLYF